MRASKASRIDLVEVVCRASCRCDPRPQTRDRCRTCQGFVAPCPHLKVDVGEGRICGLLETNQRFDSRHAFVKSRCDPVAIMTPFAESIARQYVGEDAADLLQEVFTKWLEHAPSALQPVLTDEAGGFRGYMTNALRFAAQRQHRRQRRQDPLEPRHHSPDADPPELPIHRALDVARLRSLLRALRLADPRAHAVMLGHLEGRTDREIGEDLGIARETAQRSRKRAITFFRNELKADRGI